MFIQSRLLQNGRNSAPRAEYSSALKQWAQHLPSAAAPAPRGLPPIWISSTATAWGSPHTPCPSRRLQQTQQADKPLWLPSYRGCSQASREKSCDAQCQLDCLMRSIFTVVLCFDSFGNREQNKDLGNSGQINGHKICAAYSSGRPGMELMAAFEP